MLVYRRVRHIGTSWGPIERALPPTEAEFMGFWDQVRSGSIFLWLVVTL